MIKQPSKAGYTLTISVGNTNIIFGIFAGDKYLSKWRIETRPGRAADEYGVWLMSIFQHVDIDPRYVQGAVMASVVPAVDRVLLSMCKRFFDVDPLLIQPGIKTGVKIAYGRAGDLGADRLANIVELVNRAEGQPAAIVDLGTITSIDLVDGEGTYVGGVIAPGVAQGPISLAKNAPQLSEIALRKPPAAVGRNIIHSMQSGCFWGSIDMIEGLTRRLLAEAGINEENTHIFATGGHAKTLSEGTEMFHTIDTNFTLFGLKAIYDRNI